MGSGFPEKQAIGSLDGFYLLAILKGGVDGDIKMIEEYATRYAEILTEEGKTNEAKAILAVLQGKALLPHLTETENHAIRPLRGDK